MNIIEAKSVVKAMFLQAASLSGLEVSPQSPERFSEMLDQWFIKVEESKRPLATASVLKIIAETLTYAQENNIKVLSESTVDFGKDRVCPVYPND